MKNFTRYFYLFLILLIGNPISAQVSGNWEYMNRTTPINVKNLASIAQALLDPGTNVYIEVNGIMNVKPTDFVAIFNVIQVAPTSAEADELAGERVNGLITDLIKLGIDSSEIVIDMVSLVPVFEVVTEKRLFSKTYNEVPAGFQLQKNIHIHYKKNSQLDPILSAAVKNEIYDLAKVEYFVPPAQLSYDSLAKECISYLKRRIGTINELGVRLDTAFKIVDEDQKSVYPQSMYTTYQSFCRPSMDAVSKKRSGATPAVTEIPKPVSKFYNQTGYEDFDVVVHPVVTEPVVQYTYNFVVRATVRENPIVQKEVKKEYILITPNGDTKSLPVN